MSVVSIMAMLLGEELAAEHGVSWLAVSELEQIMQRVIERSGEIAAAAIAAKERAGRGIERAP
jgi:hypothetical protein